MGSSSRTYTRGEAAARVSHRRRGGWEKTEHDGAHRWRREKGRRGCAVDIMTRPLYRCVPRGGWNGIGPSSWHWLLARRPVDAQGATDRGGCQLGEAEAVGNRLEGEAGWMATAVL
jgi:hypothetical protein